MPQITANTYVGPNWIIAASVATVRAVDLQLCANSVVLMTDSLAGGTAAFYIYSASSTAADNGSTTLKPDSVSASAAGRWMRCGGTL